MPDLATLEQMRSEILNNLADNVNMARDQSGDMVRYKDNTEMRQALNRIEIEIANLKTGKTNPFRPTINRGL